MPTFRRPPSREARTDVQGKGPAARGRRPAARPGGKGDRSPVERVRESLASLGAPRAEVQPGAVEPMLAETAPRPFSRLGWLFEPKIDGFRAIAGKAGTQATLHYRRGREATPLYPELARALAELPFASAVFDGEIAVLDESGLPSFQRLQKRSLRAQPPSLAAASRAAPAVYFGFDLLAFEGWDLRGLPLAERKRLLQLLLPRQGRLRAVEHIDEHGEELFAQIARAGLEGVMAKRADSPYVNGRSHHWLKIRRLREDAFAIVGFTRPAGARSGFGALHLALGEEPAVTHANKVLWPGEGITKGELVGYYQAIAPLLLPWLRDRPLTVTRYPNGIGGKSFFQKNAPAGAPPWLRTERTGDVDARFSEHASDADIVAPVCDDLRSLVWMANLAAIPLHIPADRFARRGSPDYSVIDLDPKEAPFAHVVQIARAVRDLCEEAGLPSFIKTSGQKGMHILLPLGASCSHGESQQLAELLVRIVEAKLPRVSTTERSIARRGGRVYLDAWQNGRGRTVVAAWSVRPVAGATVSMPLSWDEVDGRLDPRSFTLRNAVERAQSLGGDPCAPALTRKVDLPAALARLARLLRGRADKTKPRR